MRTVITGGGGFIGSAIARQVVKSFGEGDELILIDNLDRHGQTAELQALTSTKQVKFIEADLANQACMAVLPDRPDRVYNLAGIVGVDTVLSSPGRVMRVNTAIAANVVHWFVEAGGPDARLLYASTSEVYAGNVMAGFRMPVPTPEDVPAVIYDASNPRMSYAVSKLWGEMYGRFCGGEAGRLVAIVRYHNVYGPAMGHSHVIPQVIARALQKERPFRIIGSEETRSFCWIEDAAEATTRVLEAPKLRCGDVVHIGDGDGEITMRKLYEIIFKCLEWWPDEVVAVSSSRGSVPRRCPDVRFLEALTGYRAATPLTVGVRRTVEWYRDHLS
jgi:nucleoside-diphosphate-sugar epimerase